MVTFVELVRAQAVAGYLFGLVQPSVVARLLLPAPADAGNLAGRLRTAMLPHLPLQREEVSPRVEADASTQLAHEISIAVAGIQEAAGIPVACPARVDWLTDQQPDHLGRRMLQLGLPSFAPKAALRALGLVLEILNALHADSRQDALSAAQVDSLDAMITALTPMGLPGSNNIRFLHAAHALGIPVIRLPGKVFQYGWGCQGRWFKSSITDATSAIAVAQTKDKFLTNATLRLAALPVPVGRRAVDEAAAVAVADDLGYPVVVKPVDLDQGVGVAADLRNPEEVRDAFGQAARHSRNVLVEKHIPGMAFRITVFRGKSVAVVQRLPAGIIGDGTSSIAALIAEVNKDPRRSLSRFSIMKPIIVDDEATAQLAELGMDVASVPQTGQFVALKRAANLSTGGDVIVLDPAEVHPDYLALAERATTVLRLDVSGVDFVTSDIRKPVRQTGAAIIEVNAQPQMGSVLTHIHGQLLQQYVQGQGTIPTAFVLGIDKEELVRQVREGCMATRARIGTVAANGLHIGADYIAAHPGNDNAAVNALLVDPTVVSLLLATDGGALPRHGLPLPFFDALFLTRWQGAPQALASTLALLRPHLRGEVMLERGSPSWPMVVRFFGPDRVRAATSFQALTQAANQLLTPVKPT